MKVCHADRNRFYEILRRVFDRLRVRPRVLELGVLRGDNAARMDQALSPEALVLVDAWSSEPYRDYQRINAHRDWVASLDIHAEYFGGSVSEQTTFDRLYEQTRARFADAAHVQVLRAGSRAGAEHLHAQGVMPRGFDLVYVDASHQYEDVLDDLMRYAPLVSANGVLQMNDCCHSQAGVRQNLGVLEAVTHFIKVSDFAPVALTDTDYADLILARRGSPAQRATHRIIERSPIAYVEVPDALLGAARVLGPSGKVSFV
jgi:hypothetical protein